MGRGLFLAIFGGVDIGAATGQQKAVAGLKQFGHRDIARVRRNDQRHGAGNLGHGLRIHRAAGMDRVAVADQRVIADDADDGSARAVHV
jgi:hypothetical protein